MRLPRLQALLGLWRLRRLLRALGTLPLVLGLRRPVGRLRSAPVTRTKRDMAPRLSGSRGPRSTYCAGRGSPAVCGGSACGGFCVAPGQTGSTGAGGAAAGDARVGPGELVACLRIGRTGAGARAFAAAATLGGSVFGSGFMMLTGGIDAALGKSASIITFFCPARPGAAEGPPAGDVAAASAQGTSACCAQALA